MNEISSEYLEGFKIEESKNNVEYRKVQTILGDVSFSVVLPKNYAVNLGLKRGDFVKVRQANGQIIIEKA
jgi:formylmethanofuran dehydrogenase subunit D